MRPNQFLSEENGIISDEIKEIKYVFFERYKGGVVWQIDRRISKCLNNKKQVPKKVGVKRRTAKKVSTKRLSFDAWNALENGVVKK